MPIICDSHYRAQSHLPKFSLFLRIASGAHIGDSHHAQVDFGAIRFITGIITAGRHHVTVSQYVTEYAVTYQHPVTNLWIYLKDDTGSEVDSLGIAMGDLNCSKSNNLLHDDTLFAVDYIQITYSGKCFDL